MATPARPPRGPTLTRTTVSNGTEDMRVAIVTGASRGIGRSIAERLAADGMHVVLVARSVEGLKSVEVAINDAGGSAAVEPCDVGDSDAWGGLIERVADERGIV